MRFIDAHGRTIDPPPGLIERMEEMAAEGTPCLDGHDTFVVFEAAFRVKPEGAEPYPARETRIWCEECLRNGHFSTQLARPVWRTVRYRTEKTDGLKKTWTNPGYPCVYSGDVIWGWIVPGAFIPNEVQVPVPPPRIAEAVEEVIDDFVPWPDPLPACMRD